MLEFGFQLNSLVRTYIVGRMCTQFRPALDLPQRNYSSCWGVSAVLSVRHLRKNAVELHKSYALLVSGYEVNNTTIVLFDVIF